MNPADVRDLEFLFFPTTTLTTTITTQIVTNNNMQYRINFAFLHVFFFSIRVLQVAFGLDDWVMNLKDFCYPWRETGYD